MTLVLIFLLAIIILIVLFIKLTISTIRDITTIKREKGHIVALEIFILTTVLYFLYTAINLIITFYHDLS